MQFKRIPKFKNYEQEALFWKTNDALEYFDLAKCFKGKFVNLKPSQK